MKKTLSFLLSLIMVIGIIKSVPITVSAASVDDLTFELNDDGKSYYVCDCKYSASGEIVIPSTYNNKPVTSIGYEAFEQCRSLTSVTIGNSVTSIDAFAFSYCDSLTSINIPDSVTYIGKYAFYDCEKLTSVYISDLAAWCNINFEDSSSNPLYYAKNLYLNGELVSDVVIPNGVKQIPDYAFSCDSLTSINIPDSVTSIGEEAFDGCKNLESVYITDVAAWCNINFESSLSNPLYDAKNLYLNGELVSDVVIPDDVKQIPDYAFSCDNLVSVIIPNSVTDIGSSAFNGCTSLTSIDVDENNEYYSTFDGVLFNKDKTSLIRYPAGNTNTSYTIPNSVTSIGVYAFDDCTGLTSVTIGNSVTSIGDGAFCDCTNLTSITIPDSVTSIAVIAFEGCTSLAEVHYSGSLKQWENIKIGHFGNWALDSATIYFGIVEKPATPTLSSATRVSNGVKVSWGKVSGADKYIVYRKTSKSGWTNIGSTTSTSFIDTKATSGTTYYYTVKAQNKGGYSGYNTKGLGIKYVAAPKLTKIANESSGVRVYWSKVSGADGYYLYRRVAGTKSWTKIATIKKGSTTSYLDKKASVGKTYEYIIKCYDGSTPSASAAKVIKIKRLTVPKLSSTSSSKTGITFKWGKVSGAEGYIVYRKTGSGSWVKLTTVKGNTKVSYVDKSAKKGKTYTYTVKAYSGSYTSSYNTKGLKIKDKY